RAASTNLDFDGFADGASLSGNIGSSPNDLLGVSFAGGISRVTILGDSAGGSFSIDDASYTLQPTGVLGPSSLSLVGLVFLTVSLCFSRELAVGTKRVPALRLILKSL